MSIAWFEASMTVTSVESDVGHVPVDSRLVSVQG